MERYSRQIKLIGKENQEKLEKSKVCIIGLGGTGCIAAELLAGAGVNLILAENDTVKETDLHRQILFTEANIGKKKAEAGKAVIEQINSGISVQVFDGEFSEKNSDKILDCDLVLDCTDNFLTRYLINNACFEKKIPWIYSGAIKYEGMVMPISPKGKPCLKCLFPKEDIACGSESCEQVGVLGPVPNMIGSLAAAEAVKNLIGIGKYGVLYRFDLKTNKFETLKLKARNECEVCG